MGYHYIPPGAECPKSKLDNTKWFADHKSMEEPSVIIAGNAKFWKTALNKCCLVVCCVSVLLQKGVPRAGDAALLNARSPSTYRVPCSGAQHHRNHVQPCMWFQKQEDHNFKVFLLHNELKASLDTSDLASKNKNRAKKKALLNPKIPIPMSVTLFGYRVTKGTSVRLTGEYAGLNLSEIQWLKGEKQPRWDRHRLCWWALVNLTQIWTNLGGGDLSWGLASTRLPCGHRVISGQVVLCCIRR